MCLSSARRGNQTYLPTLLESLRKEISSTISTRRFVSPSLQIRIDPRAPVQSIRPFLDAWAACRHAPPPLSLAPSLPRPLNFPYTTQLRWWLFIMLERCSPLWTHHGQPRCGGPHPPPPPRATLCVATGSGDRVAQSMILIAQSMIIIAQSMIILAQSTIILAQSTIILAQSMIILAQSMITLAQSTIMRTEHNDSLCDSDSAAPSATPLPPSATGGSQGGGRTAARASGSARERAL